MTFNSVEFFVFFPLVVGLFFLFPFPNRRWFLLVAGYYFYMCKEPGYLLLLVVSTIIDYFLAIKMDSLRGQKGRKKWFIIGIIHNVGLLAAFKYAVFLGEMLKPLLKTFNILADVKGLELVAPMGISYYAFKKVGYLIDVFRENEKVERNIIDFALYVSFFPAILSGPIDRAGKLIPQFKLKTSFDYDRITGGLKLMAWGFFKKLIIADRVAVCVNTVYNKPTQYEGLSLVIATVYFAIQIYCDFSGYTDIARGVAKVLGYDMMENFNRPYFATSIGEFWKRWHISLSSWLMDYLFLPIAYSTSRKIKNPKVMHIKAETWAYFTGILSTMLICGLWHGASWTFVIWGGIHGIYLAFSFATKKLRKKITKKLNMGKHSPVANAFRMLITFSLVTFAWIFFKANTFSDAVYIITHLFTGWSKILHAGRFIEAVQLGLLKKELAVAFISIAAMFFVQILQKELPFEQWISNRKTLVRWSFYLILLVWILTFSDTGAESFIYFRF